MIFSDADPRKELIERILINKPRIHDTDTNEILVAKAIESVKKVVLTDSDFSNIKKEVFAFSSIISDKYADILAREINKAHEYEFIIASFGSGVHGGMERLLHEKMNLRLEGNKKRIRFVGLDTYVPEDFSDSFFEKGNFYKLDQNEKRHFSDIIGVASHVKLIIIANYVLHHQRASIPEFKQRCSGASAIILDEPVDRQKWRNKDYRFAVIAYDLLANIALNPEWAKIFMEEPTAFFVNYLFIDQLEHLGEENIYFDTYPLVSLTKI